ncbi:MAG: metallophosphoesterase family protein [Desulfobaccales bacterium]
MVVGLVSDTHGNQQGMLLLAKRLKDLGIKTVLHLGDDYRDFDTLTQAGLKVFGVPGVYCPEYRDPAIPNRLILELRGLKFLLTHTETRHKCDSPDDPDPEMACYEVDAVLFGHSHTPILKERQGIPWINPGHLRDRPDRGHPPTFALLHLSPPELRVQVRRLADGRPILERVFRTGLRDNPPF